MREIGMSRGKIAAASNRTRLRMLARRCTLSCIAGRRRVRLIELASLEDGLLDGEVYGSGRWWGRN